MQILAQCSSPREQVQSSKVRARLDTCGEQKKWRRGFKSAEGAGCVISWMSLETQGGDREKPDLEALHRPLGDLPRACLSSHLKPSTAPTSECTLNFRAFSGSGSGQAS